MLTCAICTHQQNQTVSIPGTKIQREVEGSSCSDLYVTGPTHLYCDDSEKVPPTCGKKCGPCVYLWGSGCDSGPRPLRRLQQCGGQAGADSRFGYVHIQSRSMAPQH